MNINDQARSKKRQAVHGGWIALAVLLSGCGKSAKPAAEEEPITHVMVEAAVRGAIDKW